MRPGPGLDCFTSASSLATTRYRRAKATKRGGMGGEESGAPHTTGEAGESCPRHPVEGRGRREMDPLAGKTANTPRLEPVSTSRQRIAERARHAPGMAWVIFIASWTNGYATARSEAICRGTGCGRTRTSGSVGGQGQQRPWSTRPHSGGGAGARDHDPCGPVQVADDVPMALRLALSGMVPWQFVGQMCLFY